MWGAIVRGAVVVWNFIAPALGLAVKAVGTVSWRKVFIATALASMVVIMFRTVYACFDGFREAFTLLFGTSDVVAIGRGAALGVIKYLGMGRFVSSLQAMGSGFVKFCYLFGIDWAFYTYFQGISLWLCRQGLNLLARWGGALVRVAYDSL